MNIFIFSGGTIDPDVVRKMYSRVTPDAVIAADRGLIFCDENGIMPDCIVGDFDSLGAYDNIPIHSSGTENAPANQAADAHRLLEKYRRLGVAEDRSLVEKDWTDTESAIEKAISLRANEVWLFGATGTRLDHTMNNIFNLRRLSRAGIFGHVVDSHNYITVCCAPDEGVAEYILDLEKQYGSYVSLLPLGGEVTGLTLTGFKYPLQQEKLRPDDGGLCISNEISEKNAVISWKTGDLMIMETRD